MATKRYATTTPTSGLASYPTAVLTPRKFLSVHHDKTDKTSAVLIEDETIAANTHTSGLWRLDFVPKGAPGDQRTNGDYILEIWSGASQTGTQFTAIKADADFGAATAREFRYYLDDNAIDLSNDQITDGAFTTLYATYYAAYSKDDPEYIAKLEQEIEAAQEAIDDLGGGSGTDTGSFTATAGENLVEGVVYLDSTTYSVYQHDDPSDLVQSSSVGWVTTSYSTGNTVTVYRRGNVTKPSSISSLPVGKDIWAGASGMPTWDNDATNPLTSGDYRAYLGRATTSTILALNCNVPIMGVEA